MGFRLVIGFSEILSNVTTNNYSAIANSHILQFTTARTKSSQPAVDISIGCLLVTASNTVASSASVFTSLLACNCLTTHSLLQLTNFQTGDHLTTNLSSLLSAAVPRYIASARTAQETPIPTVLLSCITKISHGPRREHRFPVTPLLFVTNLLRPLPSKSGCLHK
jgi:hypothetical protein